MKRTAQIKGIFRQPEWVLAVAATLAVVWLHFYFLWHAGGLWRDEVNLVNLSSRHSLAQMSRDSFPILMPLLVAGWTAVGLGQTDFSLRLLGTLIGLSIPVALWLAAWKIRRRPPLLGLALLAFNSTVIMFGDSLRAFGLGSVTILLTVAGACWFLQKPVWRRAWVLAALAIFSVQTLFQNAVFIAAICFGAWAVCLRQKDVRMAAKVLVVAAVSAASLLPYWARLAALPRAAAALRTGFKPMYVFANLDNAAGFPWEQYTWVWGFFTLVIVAGAGASLFARSKKVNKLSSGDSSGGTPWLGTTTLVLAVATVAGFFWFAAAPATRWIYFPLAVAAVVAGDFWAGRRFPCGRQNGSQRAGPEAGAPSRGNLTLFGGVTLLAAFIGFAEFLWYAALASEPWYFLPLLALAAAVFELGLPPGGRHFRAAIFGFAVATVALAVPTARGDLNWRFTNIDLIAQRLNAEAGPGDFIVVTPWYCGITFDRYYKGRAAWNTLPPLKDHSIHRYDLVREAMETPGAIQPVLAKAASTLRAGHRVWFIGTMDGVPKAGRPMPADLPPAPTNYFGPELRYTWNWTSQVAQFLSNESRQFNLEYYTTNQSVNSAEDLKLFEAGGWQGAASSGESGNTNFHK